jgi:hypothetical protein
MAVSGVVADTYRPLLDLVDVVLDALPEVLLPFWLANQLWRLDPERAVARVLLPAPHHDWRLPRRPYRLHDRADRARAYELILREGSPRDLLDYIDGALLVDIWKELDLPDPIRRAWQPLILKTLATRRQRRATDRGKRRSTRGAHATATQSAVSLSTVRAGGVRRSPQQLSPGPFH